MRTRRQAIWTIVILLATCGQAAWAMGNAETAKNPIIWADVPVMKSTNLVDWEIVSYVYDVLAAGDAQTWSEAKS